MPFVHTHLHPSAGCDQTSPSSLQDVPNWFLLSHLKESGIGNFFRPEHSHDSSETGGMKGGKSAAIMFRHSPTFGSIKCWQD